MCELLCLVQRMAVPDQMKAVEVWNGASEKLQVRTVSASLFVIVIIFETMAILHMRRT